MYPARMTAFKNTANIYPMHPAWEQKWPVGTRPRVKHYRSF